MACLEPYETLYFFLTLYFINKFCVLACLIIWMHTKFYLFYTVALKAYFAPQKYCAVFKFNGYPSECITRWFNLYLINEN